MYFAFLPPGRLFKNSC